MRQTIEIIIAIVIIPMLIVGIGIFSTNEFEFLGGFYLWDFLTK